MAFYAPSWLGEELKNFETLLLNGFFFVLQIALTGVTFLPTDESAPSKQELLVASKFVINFIKSGKNCNNFVKDIFFVCVRNKDFYNLCAELLVSFDECN